MRPRLHTGCSVPRCKNPHQAGGFCQAHYAAEKRGFLTDLPQGSGAAPSNDPGPEDSVSADVTVLEQGVLRRGETFQLIGVYCPDCHGDLIAPRVRNKPEVAWCLSDRHPLFDATGRLLKRVAS